MLVNGIFHDIFLRKYVSKLFDIWVLAWYWSVVRRNAFLSVAYMIPCIPFLHLILHHLWYRFCLWPISQQLHFRTVWYLSCSMLLVSCEVQCMFMYVANMGTEPDTHSITNRRFWIPVIEIRIRIKRMGGAVSTKEFSEYSVTSGLILIFKIDDLIIVFILQTFKISDIFLYLYISFHEYESTSKSSFGGKNWYITCEIPEFILLVNPHKSHLYNIYIYT